MIELLIVLVAGYLIGRVHERWLTPPPGPRRYEYQTSPHTTLTLHYLGSLDERRFKLLCNWVADGKPFRLQALTNAKVLTRTQFEGARKELLDRGLAYQNTNKTIEITPPGRAFFRWGAGRNKQANRK